MSNIKKDLLLCFLLEDYCKHNNFDFNILFNKLKNENLIDINYQLSDTPKILNNLIQQTNTSQEIIPDSFNRINNYNIKQNIGNGSFGSVFKCINNIDLKEYAMKIIRLHSDKYETILREVRLMSQLDHPNIVKYYCSWIDNGTSMINLVNMGTSSGEESANSANSANSVNSDNSLIPINYLKNYYLFIQMELCSNSLDNYLQTNIFDYNIRLKIFTDIVTGINYLHRNNIIHRDIKPSNILFDSNNNIKISDFGMSIKQDSNLKDSFIGSDMFGSYLYIAPESLENNSYSIYSDIFSIGIILFELLNTFTTIMEKTIEIKRLKETGEFTDAFVGKYKYESMFILKLIHSNFHIRPLTSEILSSIKLLFKE